jgi:hypothetical protein
MAHPLIDALWPNYVEEASLVITILVCVVLVQAPYPLEIQFHINV